MTSDAGKAQGSIDQISDDELKAASGGANVRISGNPNVSIKVNNVGSQKIVENGNTVLNEPGSSSGSDPFGPGFPFNN